MKIIKKLIVLVVSLSLIAVIAGCGNSNSGAVNQTQTETQPASVTGSLSDAKTAKARALQVADVSEDSAAFTKVWKETDDGVEQWEIQFVSNGQKYEIELNAADASVREQSSEAVIKGSAPGGCITADQAKSTALSATGVSADQAIFTEVKFETDDGIQKWELDFYEPNGKHDVELNAANGAVLESSVESVKMMQ